MRARSMGRWTPNVQTINFNRMYFAFVSAGMLITAQKLHLIVCWRCVVFMLNLLFVLRFCLSILFVDSHLSYTFLQSVLSTHTNNKKKQHQARVYLLSSGFSLAFGSMFAKTYRVHRIFTRSGSSVCKDKMLQDAQLISLVCALLLLDGLVLTFWVLFDPMERHLSNLTLEISLTDRSVVYQPQVNNK